MAATVTAGTVAESASATSIVVNVPAGVVSGDLLIAVISGPGQTAATTPPSGWTLGKAQNGFDAAANDGTSTFYRVADGSEAASYTFTNTGTANRMAGVILHITGQDGTTPFDTATLSSSAAAAASFTSPSITTTTADALVIYALSANAATAADITAGDTGPTALTNTTGTGRRQRVFYETFASSGATPSRNWTLSSSVQSTAHTIAIRSGGGGTGAPTPTLAQRIVGLSDTPSTAMKVNTRTSNATSVRLKVGTNSAVTTGVVFGTPATPDTDGFAELTVSGLSPGTRYFYRVAMTDGDGVEHLDTQATVGELVTAPTGPAGFAFCFGSCTNTANPAVLGQIAARRDSLFFHLGDFYYDDGTGNSLANIASHMDAKITSANHAELFATTPTAYTPSDHDGMNNNSTAGSDPTAWTNWNTAYRQRFATPTLPAGQGAYFAFSWGRVRFVQIDTSSFKTIASATDNASKTALGATQKQWLKDEITNATEPVVVIINADPWDGAAVAGDDGWMGYTTERAELGTFFAASGKQIIMLGGDMHALAADDGTNTDGGIVVWQAAPFYNTASLKGGPYSEGTYPTTGGALAEQYGRCVVTDDGTTLTLAYTGYSSGGTARITQTTTVSTPTLLPPAGLTATPVSASEIDLSWTAAAGATGYDIERDSVVIASGHVGTTYSDTGLDPSTTYTYRVRSVG